MIQSFYRSVMRVSAHPRASLALAVISFSESIVFPVPTDIALIPMVIARHQKAWLYAAIATVSSVCGGICGYFIGYAFFTTWGEPILSWLDLQESAQEWRSSLHEQGFFAILIAGITPVPYKLVTITSGVVHFDLTIFIAASLVARGIRFYGVCGLLYFFGPRIRHIIETFLSLPVTLACLAVFCILLWVRAVFS